MNLINKVENIILQCTELYEFEQKQVISVLIALMLNDKPNNEAKEIYNNINKQLNK